MKKFVVCRYCDGEEVFSDGTICSMCEGEGGDWIEDTKMPEVPVDQELFGIGVAIKEMRDGRRVARKGWNATGQWLSLTQGQRVPYLNFWSGQNRAHAYEQPDRCMLVRDYVTLKTVNDEVVPWVCSQSDLLAADWFTIEEVTSGR